MRRRTKPNERCNLVGNRFTALARLSIQGCDTPAIVRNEFRAQRAAMVRPSALSSSGAPVLRMSNRPSVSPAISPVRKARGDTHKVLASIVAGSSPASIASSVSSAAAARSPSSIAAVPITTAPPRPSATLIARSLSPKSGAAAVALATREGAS